MLTPELLQLLDSVLRGFRLDHDDDRSVIAGGIPVGRSIQVRMGLIDLWPDHLVRQDIVNPIIGIGQPPVVSPAVSLCICQGNLLQAIWTLARTQNLLNRRLILS